MNELLEVCRAFSENAEQLFILHYERRGLRLPRYPRGYLAVSPFPRRYFLRLHACLVCMLICNHALPHIVAVSSHFKFGNICKRCFRDAEWIVRDRARTQVGLICKQCLRSPELHKQLDKYLLTVDTISRRGKVQVEMESSKEFGLNYF
eukprot:gene534-3855_t